MFDSECEKSSVDLGINIKNNINRSDIYIMFVDISYVNFNNFIENDIKNIKKK
jgi:hypothetical protein